MNHLNSIILEGNCVNDAVLTEPKAGFKVCKITIAVNRKIKNADGETVEEVSYFDTECYGHMAEISVNAAKKGRGLRIVGRLKQSRWEDEGVSKSKVYVVAEHIEYKPSFKSSEKEAEKTA